MLLPAMQWIVTNREMQWLLIDGPSSRGPKLLELLQPLHEVQLHEPMQNRGLGHVSNGAQFPLHGQLARVDHRRSKSVPNQRQERGESQYDSSEMAVRRDNFGEILPRLSLPTCQPSASRIRDLLRSADLVVHDGMFTKYNHLSRRRYHEILVHG